MGKDETENSSKLGKNFSMSAFQTQPATGKNKKNPTTQKQEQDMMIFNEVFIQPRATKLNALMQQHE